VFRIKVGVCGNLPENLFGIFSTVACDIGGRSVRCRNEETAEPEAVTQRYCHLAHSYTMTSVVNSHAPDSRNLDREWRRHREPEHPDCRLANGDGALDISRNDGLQSVGDGVDGIERHRRLPGTSCEAIENESLLLCDVEGLNLSHSHEATMA
jgi:hypothetical protein